MPDTCGIIERQSSPYQHRYSDAASGLIEGFREDGSFPGPGLSLLVEVNLYSGVGHVIVLDDPADLSISDRMVIAPMTGKENMHALCDTAMKRYRTAATVAEEAGKSEIRNRVGLAGTRPPGQAAFTPDGCGADVGPPVDRQGRGNAVVHSVHSEPTESRNRRPRSHRPDSESDAETSRAARGRAGRRAPVHAGRCRVGVRGGAESV